MNFWNNFVAKHPAAAKWVREGGLKSEAKRS